MQRSVAYKLIEMGIQPMEMRPPYFFHVNIIMSTRLDKKPTTALFWQQTGLALQEFPPTPMTEMGEQLIPRRTSTPWTTIPSRPSKRLPAGELAYKHDRIT